MKKTIFLKIVKNFLIKIILFFENKIINSVEFKFKFKFKSNLNFLKNEISFCINAYFYYYI